MPYFNISKHIHNVLPNCSTKVNYQKIKAPVPPISLAMPAPQKTLEMNVAREEGVVET